jgi:hypothetical protein
MNEDKDYIELFCRVTLSEHGFTAEPCDEIPSPRCAEVMIPYHTATTIYAVTCYVTNFANDRPVIIEALAIQDHINRHGIGDFQKK